MRILITGSSGLIGSHLIPFMKSQGYDITRLVRNKKIVSPSNIFWDPVINELDSNALENFQVVIHLAG